MSTLNFKPRVPIFDANVGVGHRHNRRSPCDTPEQLLQELARHGIGRALVYPIQGEIISPIQANDSLVSWTALNKTLIPQYVATPESLSQLTDLHKDGKISSIRLHNTTECRLPFVPWVYGNLLEWLCDANIPLWISLADTPPTEIVDTLSNYPGLSVVLVGAHYVHSMMIRPLLRALPDAFLELSRYENIAGVEKLVREFGARRFLYGSFFPRFAMGPMLFFLHHLSISEKDLTSICATNLEQILKPSTKT